MNAVINKNRFLEEFQEKASKSFYNNGLFDKAFLEHNPLHSAKKHPFYSKNNQLGVSGLLFHHMRRSNDGDYRYLNVSILS